MKWLALLLLGAGSVVPCANAQGLTLSPVMISAPAEGGAASLTVNSDLTAPKLVQVRVFDWTQTGGGDQMVPSTSVRFGPEIFEIAPGRSQTVRFELPDTDGQGTWRVVVDELPSGDAAASDGAAGLSLRLRYVLSMFAAPAGDPASLQVATNEAGIELLNPGPGWLKMHDVALVSADGAELSAASGIVYLLPGASTRLPVTADSAVYGSLTYAVGAQTYSVDLRPEK